jgi:hypothetical protein
MIKRTHPNLSIPNPIYGSELGSFAHDTVVRRLPAIVSRAIDENDFPEEIVRDLQTLMAEIPHCPIRLLEDPNAPDDKEWQCCIQPHLGFNWLDVPWFFVEFYLYRRILEVTGYFRPGGSGYLRDPYALQKQMGLESANVTVHSLAASVNRWIADQAGMSDSIRHVLRVALWGNKADMSLWPINGEDQAQIKPAEVESEKIIIDDSDRVVEYLCGLKPGTARIDLLLDNAGFELVADLCLADVLLSTGLARKVVLRPKAYPVYVSDAMVKDVEDVLPFLERQSSPEIDLVIKRLRNLLQEGRLTFQVDAFWTLPMALWEMPESLRSDLDDSDLLISKGDAHYRRLLGDRHWPPGTPFADILSYLSPPILALRLGKSEVVCGLEPGRVESLHQKDPGWMTDGKWGWIQFKR